MNAKVMAGLAALAVGAAAGAAAHAQDKYEVKVATFVGPQHFMSQWLVKWSEKIGRAHV